MERAFFEAGKALAELRDGLTPRRILLAKVLQTYKQKCYN
ncbi:hypothetical protein COO91_10543 (plasmid) [Nostoc flagelliforme CCNUN1]|uniref:Uncharacterized protein n=1 Tax=Nostoc flagelliforme CCNUN1 TaxID=2038116 RepID=A0A2K8T9I7_9NOSO|nr:hypothetical protein COO91_10543 [Nostoc flagelliforme CCNUN1]